MASNWKLTNRVWHANLGMAAGITLGIIALSCPFIAHKGDFAFGKALMQIHYGEFLTPQWRWVWIDSQGFLLGFLVVSGLLMHRKAVKNAASKAADDPAVAGSSVTLLDLADTARAFVQAGQSRGLRVFRCTAEALPKLRLENERWLVIAPGVAAQQVVDLFSSTKPGALKRLEFALPKDMPPDDATACSNALVAAGAKPIKLTAADVPWMERVLDALCRESATLRPAASKSPNVKAKAAPAFTFLEMLLAMAIFALLVGGTAGALGRLARGERVHTAAEEMVGMVRAARSLAVREGTWVRLAFLPDGGERELLGVGDPDHPRMGCALYVLRRPAVTAPAAMVIRPTASLETSGSLIEVVSTSRVPLPRSLLAGWDLAPGHQKWVLWDESVRVTGAVLDGFSGEAESSGATSYLWQPALVWDEATRPHLDVAPEHDLTPARPMRKLISAPLESNVATSIWGTQPVLHWSDDDEDDASLIPAVDFQPDGSLACAALHDELIFSFEHRYNEAHHVTRVVITTHTGEARIE